MSARPGRIVTEKTVTTPRPRTLASSYEAGPMAIVQELRDRISAARQAA